MVRTQLVARASPHAKREHSSGASLSQLRVREAPLAAGTRVALRGAAASLGRVPDPRASVRDVVASLSRARLEH